MNRPASLILLASRRRAKGFLLAHCWDKRPRRRAGGICVCGGKKRKKRRKKKRYNGSGSINRKSSAMLLHTIQHTSFSQSNAFLFLNIIILIITTKQVMFDIDTGEPFGAQRQHVLAFEWLSLVKTISLPYSIFHKSLIGVQCFLFIYCQAAVRCSKEKK